MPTSIQLFTTESINLATYLVDEGYVLNILPPTFGNRARFEFTGTSQLLDAVVDYESGYQGAKKLLDIRGRLYRESSAVVRSVHQEAAQVARHG